MTTNITAISAGTPAVGTKGARQFQGLFDVIPFVVTLTDATLAAQAAGQVDITVTGAALGDFVLLAPEVDVTGLLVHGFVRAANSVTITTFNVEGTDAVTTMSTGIVFNGLILKPKGAYQSLGT